MVTITPTPRQVGGLKDAIREQTVRIGELAVPERLSRPHPIIAAWLDDHRQRLDRARRERDPWRRRLYAVPEFTNAERRRHRLLNALFRALEKHGATVSENDRRQLVATVTGEPIELTCHEKSKQVRRPLTADEKHWETWNRSGVKKELQPTGRFEFQIRAWTDQPLRKIWLETERQSAESMLPEIVATFLVLGPVLAERTRRREEQRRIWEDQQRRREIERQKRQQDDNRWRRFLQIAEGAKSSELAREFIARMRQLDLPESEPIDGRTLSEWLDWAEVKAKEADPVRRGIEAIFGDIAAVGAWSHQLTIRPEPRPSCAAQVRHNYPFSGESDTES